MNIREYLKHTNPETLLELEALRKKVETEVAYRQNAVQKLRRQTDSVQTKVKK